MKELLKQLIKFGLTGVLCFAIDYGLMVFMVEVAGMHYLLSCALSFSVSVTVNYFLSINFVFKTTTNIKKSVLFFIFIILSIIGLGINEVIMLICVEKLYIYYMYAKIIATIIVMVFNFITRKLILEKKQVKEM